MTSWSMIKSSGMITGTTHLSNDFSYFICSAYGLKSSNGIIIYKFNVAVRFSCGLCLALYGWSSTIAWFHGCLITAIAKVGHRRSVLVGFVWNLLRFFIVQWVWLFSFPRALTNRFIWASVSVAANVVQLSMPNRERVFSFCCPLFF